MEFTNRLAQESSPYLQEHAHNPVDWYPWSNEAIEKAKAENKPILLSIGYSACHWCHVMADESFADLETAKLMNELFVNIKVDREERPDLDKIYQTAHYILTQQNGGWPLTLFLTPDLTPFFSGTYFPKEDRYQLPAFKKVLQTIAQIYHRDFEKLSQQNHEIRRILQNQNSITLPLDDSVSSKKINIEPIHETLKTLQKSYDSMYGGFDGAPKFPQSPLLSFLLMQRSEMAFETLKKMALGGIYDQLGGGFFRYTVDAQWQIPHFEKMLSDNGQLLYLYAQAYALSGDDFYALIADETARWALSMQDTQGGFYGSIDADSEGKEGKFYVWNLDDIKKSLTAEEFNAIYQHFGLDKPPNFESQWHLVRTSFAKPTLINTVKSKLYAERTKRPSPHIDKKILIAANSLIIKGLFRTGQLLQKPEFIVAADAALHFIEKNLWQNHCLYTAVIGNHTKIKAYLDDYVFLMDALITALETQWQTRYLNFALQLMDTLYSHFSDKNAGFYFTSDEHETVLYRPKSFLDEAMPSGNGILIQVLSKLGYLLGEEKYLATAEKMLLTIWSYLQSHPVQHVSSVIGLQTLINPPPLIILRGEENEMKIWRKVIPKFYQNVFAIPKHADLPPALAARKVTGKIGAYICQGTTCSAVISELEVFQNHFV